MHTDRRIRLSLAAWGVVAAFGLILILGAGALAQTPSAERAERHRVPADFMSFRGAEWLERAERVDEERPDLVLDAMGLEPGDVVADVGCGSGYYARRVAGRVAPGGRVYCVDIQPEMLDIMRELADRDGVTGIVPVRSEPDDLGLPAGAVDWIVLADVYHEMSDYEAMLAGMRAALAPGGRVALLEYRIEDGTGDNLKADHAMSVRQVLAEWLPAGFALVDLHEFLPGQHLFILKAAGDDTVARGAIRNLDLSAAVEQGLVEAEARGAGETGVTVRLRNLSGDRLVVTMPVGVSFPADGGRRDMVSRRDARHPAVRRPVARLGGAIGGTPARPSAGGAGRRPAHRAAGEPRRSRSADVRDAGGHLPGIQLAAALHPPHPRHRAGGGVDCRGGPPLRRHRPRPSGRADAHPVRGGVRVRLLRPRRHRRPVPAHLGRTANASSAPSAIRV